VICYNHNQLSVHPVITVSTKNCNNWVYVAYTDSNLKHIPEWCVWLHASFLCVHNSISVELVSHDDDLIQVRARYECCKNLTSNHWYCVATAGYSNVVAIVRWHTYKRTTAWLNGNSSATLSIAMVLPSPWGTEHPHHYTISFPYRWLPWFTRHWMVNTLTEGRGV